MSLIGFLMQILSINAAVLSVILVGLAIVEIKEQFEYNIKTREINCYHCILVYLQQNPHIKTVHLKFHDSFEIVLSKVVLKS